MCSEIRWKSEQIDCFERHTLFISEDDIVLQDLPLMLNVGMTRRVYLSKFLDHF